ncbi:MAG: tRNA-dihydrouridine synthase family protein [Dorea sp.]|nr:tRNA-dihydrouridine synthase family protein [Dorea sp.]
MKYYLAPLEGITTYVYRRAYHSCFRPMDKYFTPFLVPHTKKDFNSREKNEILPEHNEGMYLVPQILTNCAEDFLRTAGKLKDYGYREVNLNLGCPSKTVVSKYRGSGFLAKPEELDRFLDQVFQKADVKVSIKTRIGKLHAQEFEELLRIYNQYPLEELIIHPRVQQDFYKNTPNLEMYDYAVNNSEHSLCYNGDIFTVKDADRIRERFPKTNVLMLGRGVIYNPCLTEELEGTRKSGEVDRKRLRIFHDRLLNDYKEVNSGDKNVLFKMKEIWCYMGYLFPASEKSLKKIKKAERLERYMEAVNEIL